jgi:hypothetical protein
MGAAASGNSTLGIPKKVGKEFIDADKGGKLPNKKTKKGENGVAGGSPPGIDAQTNMKMAEASASMSDSKGSHSVSVSESSGGNTEVRTRSSLKDAAMEKDEDLNDFMAKVHRGKIDGKVPKRIKENPEHAPNNDVLADKPQAKDDINSGGIETVEGDFGSEVCNKDELDKAHPIVEGAKIGAMHGMARAHDAHAGDPQKVIAGGLVGGAVGGAKSVFHHLKGKMGVQKTSMMPTKAGSGGTGVAGTGMAGESGMMMTEGKVKKAMSGSGAISGGASAAPMTLGMNEKVKKADSFPNDKGNPLLEGYSKSRRLQEIQKADPTWLSEDKAAQRQNTWPSKTQGDVLKAQPVTPAPVKPMSPPAPKAIGMPAMKKNVPNLTKKSRLPGTPQGDALQAAFPKTTDVAAPKVKMPSPEDHAQRAQSFNDFIPKGKKF